MQPIRTELATAKNIEEIHCEENHTQSNDSEEGSKVWGACKDLQTTEEREMLTMKTNSNACPHCGKSLAQTSFTENPKQMPVTSLKHKIPAPVVMDDLLGEEPKTKVKKA